MAQLRARRLFASTGLAVFAVESVNAKRRPTRSGCLVYGSIEPVAVIVRTPAGTRALDLESKAVTFDELEVIQRELER